MNEMFPGLIEITCPFCGDYKHAKPDEMDALKQRSLDSIDELNVVACDSCWKLVELYKNKTGQK